MPFDIQPVNNPAQANNYGTAPQKFDIQPVSNSYSTQPIASNQPQLGVDINPHDNPMGKGVPSALIAGLSTSAANLGEGVADAGLWAANMLGLSDKTTQDLKDQFSKAANLARVIPDANGDSFQQAAAQHPYLYNATKYGPATGFVLKSSLGKLIPGSGAANAAANVGMRTLGNVGVATGLAGPEKDSQDFAAGLAAVASPLSEVAAIGINKLASSLTLTKKLQDAISPIITKIKSMGNLSTEDQAVQAEAAFTKKAMQQNNANYQVIKAIPGTIDTQSIQPQVNTLIQQIQSRSASKESTPLLNVLQTVQEDMGSAKNMEDALQIRQYIAGNKDIFQGKQVSSTLYKGYNQLQQSVDKLIESKAEEAGVSSALTKANSYYSMVMQPLNNSGAMDRLQAVTKQLQTDAYNAHPENIQNGIKAPNPPEYSQATKQIFQANMSPQKVEELLTRLGPEGNQIMQNKFIQDIFRDVGTNPENFSKNSALIKLNNITSKYAKVLSPESLQTFEGMKTVLKQAGAIAKNEGSSHAYLEHYAGHVIGGSIGGAFGTYEGYQHGGGTGAAIGGMVGIAGGASVFNAFKQGLVDTSLGQKVLQYIAKNPSKTKELLLPAIQAGPAALSNKTE